MRRILALGLLVSGLLVPPARANVSCKLDFAHPYMGTLLPNALKPALSLSAPES